MKFRSLPLFAAASALAMVSIAFTRPARAADTYEIPAILSLTGIGAFLATQQHDSLRLFETAANASGGIRGKKIHFDFQDDQSSPQVAVQLTTEVAANHPALILGPNLVGTCNAIAPLLKSGPLDYCFSPGIHPPDGSYVFTAGTSTFDQADALVRFFRLKGWTRLALATSTDATGQDADRGFEQLLALAENKDIKLAAHVHFNINDVSVSAQMEQIRAANAQAFIVWSTGSPAGIMFRGFTQAGLDLPVGTTGGNMTYAQMKQFAAFLPKDLYLPTSEWAVGDDSRVKLDPAVAAKQKEFYGAYQAAGKKPDEGSVLAWDPATILVDVLRQAPDGMTATQLRDRLVHLARQPAVSGFFDYGKTPQRGLSIDNVVVTRWTPDADKWVLVAGPTGVPLDK